MSLHTGDSKTHKKKVDGLGTNYNTTRETGKRYRRGTNS